MVKLSKQYRRAVQDGMSQVREGQVLVGYFMVDAVLCVAIDNYQLLHVDRYTYLDNIRILERIRESISFVEVRKQL